MRQMAWGQEQDLSKMPEETPGEMTREEDISNAIGRLSGDAFECFARELLRRELYPGLNPTSRSHDLGEDARTERTTVFMHNGRWVSLIASKTCELTKIKSDCRRCRDTARRIDDIVFATAGNPRTDTVERWREEVKQEFGWHLEVRPLFWLAPAASAPQHESLVNDHLHIPPPGGDYTGAIEDEFSRCTDRALNRIQVVIPGIPDSIPRQEIDRVEEQLSQGKQVVLTGEAGTGKSAIGASLACSARDRGVVAFLLDARDVGHVRNESELRPYLSLNGPVASAVGRIGRHKGCRLILDQLDNVAGLQSAQVLVDLAVECSKLTGVDVVVVSRRREAHEASLLDRLSSEGFVELTSYPLSEDTAAEILQELGISKPPPGLVALALNLLNLQLIGTIRQKQPRCDFSNLIDEVDLWEHYIQALVEREQVMSGAEAAEEVVAEAVRLAHSGLNSEDRTFCLRHPVPPAHRRLTSWGIIVCEGGRVYRFRHEKLQDFIYAWDATEQQAMPRNVLGEIESPHRARNVLVWMNLIYSQRSPELRRRFLMEVLSVQ